MASQSPTTGRLPRRAFLGALTTVPLIGGAVPLIGSPDAAAEAAPSALLARYRDWLAVEYGRTLVEMAGAGLSPERAAVVKAHRRDWCARSLHMPVEAFEVPAGAAPSSRAALVLDAAGCDWRRA